jgi:hypothetical protein
MNTLRAVIATAALATATGAYAQVRVITPDSEHVYSTDPARPQQLPDDEALKLQNERAERARIARRKAEADQAATTSKSQQGSPNVYQPPTSGRTDR